MPKIEFISQAELRAVSTDYNALGLAILDIRRRMKAGATVEPGPISATSDDDIVIEDHLRDGSVDPEGFVLLGLETTQQKLSSPDWWRDGTPLAIEYILVMQVDEKWEQEVQLTRAEFIALKEYLAVKIRGYEPMETPDA